MAKATKRRTVLGYLRSASERMERAVRAAARCNTVPAGEMRALLDHYRRTLRVEATFRRKRP